jgi:hypothetical protein
MMTEQITVSRQMDTQGRSGQRAAQNAVISIQQRRFTPTYKI